MSSMHRSFLSTPRPSSLPVPLSSSSLFPPSGSATLGEVDGQLFAYAVGDSDSGNSSAEFTQFLQRGGQLFNPILLPPRFSAAPVGSIQLLRAGDQGASDEQEGLAKKAKAALNFIYSTFCPSLPYSYSSPPSSGPLPIFSPPYAIHCIAWHAYTLECAILVKSTTQQQHNNNADPSASAAEDAFEVHFYSFDSSISPASNIPVGGSFATLSLADPRMAQCGDVKFSPVLPNMLAVACKSGIALWQITHDKDKKSAWVCFLSTAHHGERIERLTFSPCGRYLAATAAGSTTVCVWDLSLAVVGSGSVPSSVGYGCTPFTGGALGLGIGCGPATNVQWDSSGATMMIAYERGQVQLYECSHPSPDFWTGRPFLAFAKAIPPTALVTAGGQGNADRQPSSALRGLNSSLSSAVPGASHLASLPSSSSLPRYPPGSRLLVSALSPLGQHMIYAPHTGLTIIAHNISAESKRMECGSSFSFDSHLSAHHPDVAARFHGHGSHIAAIAWSPQGERVAVAFGDGELVGLLHVELAIKIQFKFIGFIRGPPSRSIGHDGAAATGMGAGVGANSERKTRGGLFSDHRGNKSSHLNPSHAPASGLRGYDRPFNDLLDDNALALDEAPGRSATARTPYSSLRSRGAAGSRNARAAMKDPMNDSFEDAAAAGEGEEAKERPPVYSTPSYPSLRARDRHADGDETPGPSGESPGFSPIQPVATPAPGGRQALDGGALDRPVSPCFHSLGLAYSPLSALVAATPFAAYTPSSTAAALGGRGAQGDGDLLAIAWRSGCVSVVPMYHERNKSEAKNMDKMPSSMMDSMAGGGSAMKNNSSMSQNASANNFTTGAGGFSARKPVGNPSFSTPGPASNSRSSFGPGTAPLSALRSGPGAGAASLFAQGPATPWTNRGDSNRKKYF